MLKRFILFSTLLYTFIVLVSCDKETKRMKGYAVHGIDVSHYQSYINWDTVAIQDIDFVFMKASEGESITDSLFERNWNALNKFDIKKGAYHFFRPGTNVESQFKNFTNNLKLKTGDLPPVLDVEVTDNLSNEVIIKRVQQWLNLAEDKYKTKPIIYSNLKYYNAIIAGNFDEYPIWIARYSTSKPILDYGNSWTFWQYGNKGKLNGIEGDVDFNVFNGTLSDLEEIGFDASRVSQILD